MEVKSVKTNVLTHLSVLWGCIIPFGNIFGPLLVSNYWKANPQLKNMTANIINFQIFWCLLLLVLSVVSWCWQIPRLSGQEGFQTGFLTYLVVGVVAVNLLYPILVSVIIGITKRTGLYYPTLIRFIG